jgi:hypothetical protein
LLISDPFRDDAEFDLAPLPEVAVSLLVEAGAPPRLAAHLRLVHDVAGKLIDTVTSIWPQLEVDREALLFGAATHDIGKAMHPNELYQPGSDHEIAGRRFLLERGIADRLARFAETHAAWKTTDNCSLEDLFVGLADTCWKGKRSERLEDMLCSAILAQTSGDRWTIFAALDELLQALTVDGDRRLAWQSQY